jgi:general secretion pathway protein F
MQYAVKALRRDQAATLLLEARDPSDARRQAEEQGFSVIGVRVGSGGGLRLGRHSGFPLIQFNQSLLTLLQAGLSLVESIEALAERESRGDVKQTLRTLLERLYEGQNFSKALELQGAVFPALYIATVRANETTGGLEEALERFIHYRNQIDLVRKRVVAASVYPLLILGVGSLVILFLLLYVVPRFSVVFEDLGDKIPDMSRLLLNWGRFVHEQWAAVLAACLALPVLAAILAGRPLVRARVSRVIMRLPRMGEYLRIYQLARFYRTLGMLLRGGIPIVPALDMVVGLLPPAMHPQLEAARTQIRQGQSLSLAFDLNGLSNPVALRMLRVGERTGQMGEMMERVAGFLDEDIAQAIDWFIRLFEPLLMIAIGIIIGVIVLLMYAPIFELAGSIQ